MHGRSVDRGAVRLFVDFYDADVIVASPLGLATLLADSRAAAAAESADFLSSIEICVVDRADVMLMQNWTHVLTGWGRIWRPPAWLMAFHPASAKQNPTVHRLSRMSGTRSTCH